MGSPHFLVVGGGGGGDPTEKIFDNWRSKKCY